MASSSKEISAGTIGKDVWIGRHLPYYECANQRLKGFDVHILRFTVAEARAAIEMLEKQIERQSPVNAPDKATVVGRIRQNRRTE